MFKGTEEDLKQTKVTQPAIFIYSVIAAKEMRENLPAGETAFNPGMVAGHSLGEFPLLLPIKHLALRCFATVIERANAMQYACELQPSTMAAVLGLDDKVVEEVVHR